MTGLTMLDVAIGLTFIYLLLSLVCTAIRELLERFFKHRASDLERGIRELLNDTDGRGLAKKLYEHQLIFGLFQGEYDPHKIRNGKYQSGSRLPSYIPARNFALALMDVILPANDKTRSGAQGATTPASSAAMPQNPTTNPSVTGPLQALRDAIAKLGVSSGGQTALGTEKVRSALLTLIDAAGNDVAKARENIEAWYDSAMDRVSGWYKRRSQAIVLGLGLVVAVLVNADTITIATSLSNDSALRSSLVAAAQEYARKEPQGAKDEPAARLKDNLNEIRKLSLPIGWDHSDRRTMPGSDTGSWIVKIIGWLLTAFAVSLGAPFWFELLNKIMVVRATV